MAPPPVILLAHISALWMDKVQQTTTVPLSVPVLATPVIDHNDLKEWQKRLGLSYEDAAGLLGVDRSTYAAYLTGQARNTRLPVPLPRAIALSAMAIELGLHQLLPPPVPRSKKRKLGKG